MQFVFQAAFLILSKHTVYHQLVFNFIAFLLNHPKALLKHCQELHYGLIFRILFLVMTMMMMYGKD